MLTQKVSAEPSSIALLFKAGLYLLENRLLLYPMVELAVTCRNGMQPYYTILPSVRIRTPYYMIVHMAYKIDNATNTLATKGTAAQLGSSCSHLNPIKCHAHGLVSVAAHPGAIAHSAMMCSAATAC